MTTLNHEVEISECPPLRDLYLAHQSTLEAFARRRVNDSAVVEDLCQLTWIGYERWRAKRADEKVDNIVGFLINLLRYQIKSHFKNPHRDDVCIGDDLLGRCEGKLLVQVLGDPYGQVEAKIDLAAALTALKPKVRDALILTVVDELTAAEAGYVLNVSAQRVYQLTAEGRRILMSSPHLAAYGTTCDRREVR